jgi:hypothetical protein
MRFDIIQMIHDDIANFRSFDQVSCISSIIDDKFSRLTDVTCFRTSLNVSESLGMHNQFAG